MAAPPAKLPAPGPANSPASFDPYAQPLEFNGGDRYFFCGMSGSGKSTVAMELLAPLPRVVCVDLKVSETVGRYPWQQPGREAERDLERGRECRVRCTDLDTAIHYMEAAYKAGGCAVYIDEVYALIPPPAKNVPDIVTAIWTRGRELGVGGWAATQRPSWVPIVLYSEANWNFCFRLRRPEDRKTMAGFMGEEVEQPIIDKYGFWMTRDDWPAPRYVPGWGIRKQIAKKG